MKRRSPWLALALVALAAPAFAQTAERTRADEGRDAREARAVNPPPGGTSKVERLLTWLETDPRLQHMAGRRDGFGVRLGGIQNGAGLAAGPSWRRTGLVNGNLDLAASAAASIAGDRQIAARVTVPHVADRIALRVETDATHLAQERFFGLGMQSAKADRTAFLLDSRRVGATATVTATPWLQFSAGAASLSMQAAGTTGRLAPPIDSRFSIGDTPGLDRTATFAVLTAAATVDRRDVPMNPRHGGRYHVAATRYRDMDRTEHSFTRLDVEAEQHLSGWKRQRLLTVRALASTSIADEGDDVPFYLQPTLGGSRVLRGFVTDRFRDRSLVVAQAEYGWDLSPFINAVVFYEVGAVAPRLRDISAGDLRRDYGIGFRFGSARTVALRTDVAFGSGEGTRLTMRFNHAF